MSHWTQFEADSAFTAASRARRRAALLGRARRPGRAMCGLPVYDEAIHRRSGPRGVTEISLEAIAGTTEPNRATQFDQHFRPKPLTRVRWQRVWLAAQQGVTLPSELVRCHECVRALVRVDADHDLRWRFHLASSRRYDRLVAVAVGRTCLSRETDQAPTEVLAGGSRSS